MVRHVCSPPFLLASSNDDVTLVNHHISEMLLQLKEGAYVMTFEEVGVSPRGSKASARDKDAIGSKMSVSQATYGANCVSWKATGGKYLLHVMQGEQ